MPWTSRQVGKHNRKAAKSPKRSRQWAKVANAVLKRTGDEGRAVREANGAVKKAARKKTARKRR